MDPILPRLEEETRRRRRMPLFRHQQVPVRMLVPNFFTLLALCAGLTSIRMGIEGRYELALGAIVFAALLDGIDGRVARLLKASSRFGAELDSLADFVNFGVAPAFLIFNWGLGGLKSLGWICVMIFALASALRLARFNVASEERPKWEAAYFIGMPTPAAAIVVLLPVYIEHLGFEGFRTSALMLDIVLLYTLLIAFLMVSTIPTFSGKLLGERISREYVLPIFMLAIGFVALLVTYPFGTLTGATIGYLLAIPVSMRLYGKMRAAHPVGPGEHSADTPDPEPGPAEPGAAAGGRVVAIRGSDQPRKGPQA
jgi:CDP-diacylglycerol--serine O-phosphatidyltransferase